MSEGRWQSALAQLQSTGRLPSVVAGVLRDAELVWTGSVGGSVDDTYRIGSITKTMTAVAVAQLRDEGRLSFDDPVARFVPETAYAGATLRELLTHTSGMQSEPVGAWWERSPGVDFATLAAANDGSGRVAGPGDFFHYSNLGFALLGETVARLCGESWWDVVRSRVLEPLGLTRTTYRPGADAAQGYSVDHFAGTLTLEPHQDTGAMAPAGQLWSTLADLASWARFLAEGHPDVLDRASVAELARPVGPATDYGLGLRSMRFDGRRMVGHTGTMPGFQASLFVDPERRDGVVLLANGTTGVENDRVPEAFLSERDPAPVTAWVPTTVLPGEIAELLGLWFWGNSAIEIRWHNGRLQLHSLALGRLTDTFEQRDGWLVGVTGYHRGETLHVVRRDDESIGHLDCATFVYTRVPYDSAAPIPGGAPDPG